MAVVVHPERCRCRSAASPGGKLRGNAHCPDYRRRAPRHAVPGRDRRGSSPSAPRLGGRAKGDCSRDCTARHAGGGTRAPGHVARRNRLSAPRWHDAGADLTLRLHHRAWNRSAALSGADTNAVRRRQRSCDSPRRPRAGPQTLHRTTHAPRVYCLLRLRTRDRGYLALPRRLPRGGRGGVQGGCRRRGCDADVRLSLQEYFPRPGSDPERWGLPVGALLGAMEAQADLRTPAIGGKDSMSGTFEDLDVPPTLIAFAFTTGTLRASALTGAQGGGQ